MERLSGIEELYERRFGRREPETVRPIEKLASQLAAKKARRKSAKAARRAAKPRTTETA